MAAVELAGLRTLNIDASVWTWCCRYTRMSWAVTGAPDEPDFDLFVSLFRVSQFKFEQLNKTIV